jgi:hypothetical protein
LTLFFSTGRMTMARSAVLGAQDFDNVSKLVKSGAKVGEAISKVAADRGASRAAVSASFYSTKRKAGGDRHRKTSARRSASGATPVKRNVDASADIDTVAADLVRNVRALADAAKAQAEEVALLRSKLSKARRTLG